MGQLLMSKNVKNQGNKYGKPRVYNLSKNKETSRSASMRPYLSFRFLHGVKIGDFQELAKLENKKHQKYFEELQRFIYDFDNEETLSIAIRNYTSAKGSKIGQESKYVKAVITAFEANHSQFTQVFAIKELIHIHTKKRGKGKFVLFGIEHDNTFYVLAMNPEHDF